jgi:tubulin beta
MNEIIQIGVGACGNRLCCEFFDALHKNHNRVSSSLPSPVYWSMPIDDTDIARPRAVLVDLDRFELARLSEQRRYEYFREESFVRGDGSGTGSYFARGHYTAGAELVGEVVDAVRAEAERCDRLQGFELSFALGGGTGAGLGTLTMSRVQEEFPDKLFSCVCVLPSSKIGSVSPYNAGALA